MKIFRPKFVPKEKLVVPTRHHDAQHCSLRFWFSEMLISLEYSPQSASRIRFNNESMKLEFYSDADQWVPFHNEEITKKYYDWIIEKNLLGDDHGH